MIIRNEYEDADYALMNPRISKDSVKHLFYLGGTTEVIEFFEILGFIRA